MIFTEIELVGAYIVEIEQIEDERGFFARSWCRKEFMAIGLNPHLEQCNISYNRLRGTLRGMHYQVNPHREAKLVRCTRGKIYDVIVDMRGDSITYKKWTGVELSAENRRMLYVPEGFAHGYQTLEDDTEVFYQVSESYFPKCERGLRWDDPSIDIDWPISDPIISPKDSSWALIQA